MPTISVNQTTTTDVMHSGNVCLVLISWSRPFSPCLCSFDEPSALSVVETVQYKSNGLHTCALAPQCVRFLCVYTNKRRAALYTPIVQYSSYGKQDLYKVSRV